MVEKASDYHISFQAVLPPPLLGNKNLFTNHDVTNPRELYSMLSESRRKGALLTSFSVTHPSGPRLPPMAASTSSTSSDMKFRPLGEQTQHSSYPDLVSFRKHHPSTCSTLESVRRSSSLQDVSHLDHLHGAFNTKKLKPILRGSDGKGEQQEKAGVKFGRKEVRLIKDPPLPPIEGGEGLVNGANSRGASSVNSLRTGDDVPLSLANSPQPHKRHGAERAQEMFPRGQPVKVEKPGTPTYEDYPEAYWELRSPTVQEPSDLKEDMIDRDRYRLQQISKLQLRAMNREVVVNRLDTYRKWQQQLQELSPTLHAPKQDSARGMPSSNAGAVSARSQAGKQQRMSLPIRNHTLAVAAKSISPAANPATAKRDKSGSKTQDSPDEANGVVVVDVDEARRRARIEAAAKAAGDKALQSGEARPLKASVVNLCMDPDKSNSPTSDVYMGIRRITFGPRPQSDKVRTNFYSSAQSHSSHDQGQGQEQGQDQGHQVAQSYKEARSLTMASIKATMGSSQSHRLQRVPSAPTCTTPASAELAVPHGEDPELGGVAAPGSKFLLKKFNTLQVFGEKSPTMAENGEQEAGKKDQWDSVPVKPVVDKHPYLPQNRPPTYRLDMRNYPPRRHGSAGTCPAVAEGDELLTDRGGYPLLGSERGGAPPVLPKSPDKSEATSLSFRFRNGEVIVSRQGKRPNVT